MPSLETARRMHSVMTNGAKTIGQMHKEFADFTMEQTWDDDIQSRECFIYDYMHDDTPTEMDHIVHADDTTKTKIEAKFIISSYGSIDKDQVAYHLLFKPSQKIDFEEGDDLYYYETDYKQRYGSSHFIGMYIDIPNDDNIYYRWLICDYEEANQFVKYVVLPCDYRFQWVQIINGKKYKRQMWGTTRSQNSYTSGIYIDRYFTSLDNVDKFILPLNKITESFGYNDGLGDVQRLIISAKVQRPNVWQVSKLENTKPIGLLKVTTKQVPFNDDTDYIERDGNDNIIGMWADWFSADKSTPIDDDPVPTPGTDVRCYLTCTGTTLKSNGSFRTITAKFIDTEGNDVSEEYKQYTHEWIYTTVNSESEPISGKSADVVTKYVEGDPNTIKIKIQNSRDCIGDCLMVELRTNIYIWSCLDQPLSIIG